MKKGLPMTRFLAMFTALLFSGSMFAQILGPLEPITFETGSVEYVWDTWGNLNDPDAFITIENPFKSGINQSDYVGKYTCNAGSNSWAGMNIHDSVEIVITENNKFFTMDIYKSAINKVVLALELGVGEVTRFDAYPYNTTTDEWETLVFDMSSAVGHTFYRLTIQPDLTDVDPRAEESVVYLDNIKFYRNNPNVPNPLEKITFEAEGSDYEWITFDNPTDNNDDGSFTVEDNPDASGINTSAKVGKYVTHADAALWAGVKTDALTPIVITENNKWLSMDVYKTSTNNVGLKYEGGTDGKQQDCFVTPSVTGEWEKLVFDFSAVVGDTFPTFVIFPDWSSVDPRTEEAITYFDNIEWHRNNPNVPNSLEKITFEVEGSDYEWITFDNPTDNNDDGSFTVEDNPDASGINASAKVGKYVTHSDAALWAGVKTDALTPIVITENNKWLSMDVYKTSTNNVGLKYEGGTDGKQQDCFVTPSVTGEWEKLVFDFSAVVGDTFPTFVIFPDWSSVDPRTEETITYLDNIEWHETNPLTSVSESFSTDYRVFPNPATDRVVVEGVGNDAQIDVFTIDGKRIASFFLQKESGSEISLDDLKNGSYIMRIRSDGKVSSLKFVKL